MTGRSCFFNLLFLVTIVLRFKDAIGLNAFMAQLIYSNGTQELTDCAGTLISRRHVLTTAQCITKHNLSLFKVRFGEYNLAEDPDCFGRGKRGYCQHLQYIEVELAIYHEDYDPQTAANDIGLIILRKNVTFTRNVKQIRLPISKMYNENFKVAFVNGWGYFSSGVKALNLRKQNVEFTYDTSFCRGTYPTMAITDKQICITPTKGRRSCMGYPGVPLIRVSSKKMVQFGILSFGDLNCVQKQPDVFTKIEAYLDWINFHKHHKPQ